MLPISYNLALCSETWTLKPCFPPLRCVQYFSLRCHIYQEETKIRYHRDWNWISKRSSPSFIRHDTTLTDFSGLIFLITQIPILYMRYLDQATLDLMLYIVWPSHYRFAMVLKGCWKLEFMSWVYISWDFLLLVRLFLPPPLNTQLNKNQ